MAITEKDIVFVTKPLPTKWFEYQQELIKRNFPASRIIVIRPSTNWPNSWFNWIKEVKNCNVQKYFIHIDEDCFITDRNEIMRVLHYMEDNGIGLAGCPDGNYQLRWANPAAINPFLMFGNIEELRKVDFKENKLRFTSHPRGGWINNFNISFRASYFGDYHYPHPKTGEASTAKEYEPFYYFMWKMKDAGCKFLYLYPYFDDRFKSTNPRMDENSPEMAIHMWYVRSWNDDFLMEGMANSERYRRIEKYLTEQILKSKEKV